MKNAALYVRSRKKNNVKLMVKLHKNVVIVLKLCQNYLDAINDIKERVRFLKEEQKKSGEGDPVL